MGRTAVLQGHVAMQSSRTAIFSSSRDSTPYMPASCLRRVPCAYLCRTLCLLQPQTNKSWLTTRGASYWRVFGYASSCLVPRPRHRARNTYLSVDPWAAPCARSGRLLSSSHQATLGDHATQLPLAYPRQALDTWAIRSACQPGVPRALNRIHPGSTGIPSIHNP